MRIRIISAEVFTRTIKSEKYQKTFVFREQMAVAVMPEGSQPFLLSLADSAAPNGVGEYEVTDASFMVRDNKLTLGRVQLRALVAERASALDVAAARIQARPVVDGNGALRA
jgi:hypothetical protein